MMMKNQYNLLTCSTLTYIADTEAQSPPTPPPPHLHLIIFIPHFESITSELVKNTAPILPPLF